MILKEDKSVCEVNIIIATEIKANTIAEIKIPRNHLLSLVFITKTY